MKQKNKGAFEWIVVLLVIIGAINWGLVGAFDWNLIEKIFSSISWLENLTYILVGLSGLVQLYWLFK